MIINRKLWCILITISLLLLHGCEFLTERKKTCEEHDLNPALLTSYIPKFQLKGNYYINRDGKYCLTNAEVIVITGTIALIDCEYNIDQIQSLDGKIFAKELKIATNMSMDIAFEENFEWTIYNEWMYFEYNYKVEARYPDAKFYTEVKNINNQRYEVWAKYGFDVILSVGPTNVWEEY